MGRACGLDGAADASPASKSSHRAPCFLGSALKSSLQDRVGVPREFYLMLLAAQLALIWPQRATIHEDLRRLTGPRPRDSGPSFHWFGLDRASSNGAEPCLEALVPGLGDGDGLKKSSASISTLPVLLLSHVPQPSRVTTLGNQASSICETIRRKPRRSAISPHLLRWKFCLAASA